ncbi:MAG: sensor domain-containing protein [Halobacteriales archaeon]
MGATIPQVASRIVRPLGQLRTYRALGYLLVSIPLALVYWFVLGMAVTVSLLLTVVLVGVPLLVGVLLLVRGFASFERHLVNLVLGLDLEAPDDVRSADGAFESVRAYVDAPSTWRGLAFVTLRFWVAIVGVILVAIGYQALRLVSTALIRPQTVSFGEINGEPVTWTVVSVPDVALATLVGLALALAVAHLLNGTGYVVARMAEGLLAGG